MKIIEPDRPDFVDPPWFIQRALSAAPGDPKRSEISHSTPFATEPGEHQLRAMFGNVTASSATRAVDDPRSFRIAPRPQMPLWMINPILVFVLFAGLVMTWFTFAGLAKWAIGFVVLVIGSLAAAQLKSLISWVDHLCGTADYVSVDKVSGEVVLPRLGLVMAKTEVRKVVEVTPESQKHGQVAFLIEDKAPSDTSNHWVYAYVFSPFSSDGKLTEQLAQALSLPVHRLSIQ